LGSTSVFHLFVNNRIGQAQHILHFYVCLFLPKCCFLLTYNAQIEISAQIFRRLILFVNFLAKQFFDEIFQLTFDSYSFLLISAIISFEKNQSKGAPVLKISAQAYQLLLRFVGLFKASCGKPFSRKFYS
jgi:hypothetical protein